MKISFDIWRPAAGIHTSFSDGKRRQKTQTAYVDVQSCSESAREEKMSKVLFKKLLTSFMLFMFPLSVLAQECHNDFVSEAAWNFGVSPDELSKILEFGIEKGGVNLFELNDPPMTPPIFRNISWETYASRSENLKKFEDIDFKNEAVVGLVRYLTEDTERRAPYFFTSGIMSEFSTILTGKTTDIIYDVAMLRIKGMDLSSTELYHKGIENSYLSDQRLLENAIETENPFAYIEDNLAHLGCSRIIVNKAVTELMSSKSERLLRGYQGNREQLKQKLFQEIESLGIAQALENFWLEVDPSFPIRPSTDHEFYSMVFAVIDSDEYEGKLPSSLIFFLRDYVDKRERAKRDNHPLLVRFDFAEEYNQTFHTSLRKERERLALIYSAIDAVKGAHDALTGYVQDQ